jgi:hypothetical protein
MGLVALPDRSKQLAGPDLQPAGDLLYVDEAYVLLAAFNPADVVRMKVAPFRKFFLGETALQS